jgi:hypothetical protein
MGYIPYELSPCASSKEAGRRYYYDLRDLHQDFRSDKILANHVVVMVDVDYYVDMPKLLCTGLPVVMYSFVPQTLSGNNAEAEWWVEGDKIHYQVTGGARYDHLLWNYDNDYVSVLDSYKTLHVYSISQQIVPHDDSRRVIVLTPTVTVPYPFWEGVKQFPLVRRSLDAVIRTRFAGEPWVSIPLDCTTPVSLPEKLYDSLRARLRISKESSIGGITHLLKENNVPDPGIVAPLLIEALSKARPHETISKTAMIRWTNRTQSSFASPADSLEPQRPALLPTIPSVLSDPALAPVLKHANELEKVAVMERVTKRRNRVPFEPRIKVWSKEFLSFILPKTKLQPYTMIQVLDNLKTPKKREKALKTLGCLSYLFDEAFVMFLKGEAYPKATAPRLVSDLDYQHNLVIASWAIPLAKYMKKTFHWWAPGKTPEVISQRIQEIASQCELLTEADYIKFDGSQSDDMDAFFTLFVTSCFEPSDVLREKLAYERNTVGRSRNGTKVPKGPHNKTGSWFTTLRNGIINGLIVFCGYRLQGLSKETSFKHLGVLFGDDILTPFAPELANLCSMVGLGVTLRHASKGVEFLSRVFPDPASSTSSYAKPIRALAKIHLTKNGTPEELANKAFGYYITDRKTPILGHLVRAILRVCKPKESTMSQEDLFKCSMPWPQQDADLILEHAYGMIELDMTDILDFNDRCDKVATFKDLETLPVLTNTREPATIDYVDNFGELNCKSVVTVADNIIKSTTDIVSVTSNSKDGDGPTTKSTSSNDLCPTGRSSNASSKGSRKGDSRRSGECRQQSVQTQPTPSDGGSQSGTSSPSTTNDVKGKPSKSKARRERKKKKKAKGKEPAPDPTRI